jgi:uncharacterized HhH-GPD family protein
VQLALTFAAIFTSLLGKQRDVRPPGWREASAPFGEQGSFSSVADVVDKESLLKVRQTKQAAKAAKGAKGAGVRKGSGSAAPDIDPTRS